jgi:hypothetical protein
MAGEERFCSAARDLCGGEVRQDQAQTMARHDPPEADSELEKRIDFFGQRVTKRGLLIDMGVNHIVLPWSQKEDRSGLGRQVKRAYHRLRFLVEYQRRTIRGRALAVRRERPQRAAE